jgi:starvation-inducible DNA-binding protein
MNSVDELLLESLMMQMELNKLKKPPIESELEDEDEDEDEDEKEIENIVVISNRPSKQMICNAMRMILSSTFHMYFKAHAIHWNVEGINFPQYHDFFGDTYEELHEVVDRIAEYIRILGEKAPATLSRLSVKQPNDTMNENDSLDAMIVSFDCDNNRIIDILREGIKCAGACGEPAIENFLQERLDYHQKLAWKLRVIRK